MTAVTTSPASQAKTRIRCAQLRPQSLAMRLFETKKGDPLQDRPFFRCYEWLQAGRSSRAGAFGPLHVAGVGNRGVGYRCSRGTIDPEAVARAARQRRVRDGELSPVVDGNVTAGGARGDGAAVGNVGVLNGSLPRGPHHDTAPVAGCRCGVGRGERYGRSRRSVDFQVTPVAIGDRETLVLREPEGCSRGDVEDGRRSSIEVEIARDDYRCARVLPGRRRANRVASQLNHISIEGVGGIDASERGG